MTNNDMDFFFPELNPDNEGVIPLPPADVRILELKAEPVQDNGPTRLRVYIDVSAFQQRPYLDVTLHNAQGEEIASVNIIEMKRSSRANSGRIRLIATHFSKPSAPATRPR